MRRNISEILALAAAAVLAAGCAGRIDPQGYCDGTVSFAVDVAGSIEEVKAGTKAGDAQTISSFKVAAYNNNGSDHEQFIAPDTEVTVSGSSASTGIRWTKPYNKVFYAYANLPASGANVTPAYDGQTLTFTALPAAVASQTDVLLASAATNGGSTRTAALTFKHALASVTFNAGQMQNVASVNSITVKGVYSKGSVKQSSDGTFGAWSGTTATQDIAQTGLSVTPPASGSSKIGSTLLLIPQTGSIAIELGVTMTGGGTKTLTGTVSIDGNAWQAGYATTYTIGYTEGKDLHFTATVTAWGAGDNLTAELEEQTGQPNNEIWYYADSEQPFCNNDNTHTPEEIGAAFGATRYLGSFFSNGKGRYVFEGNVTVIPVFYLDGTTPTHAFVNTTMQSLYLPETVTSIHGSIYRDKLPFDGAVIEEIHFGYNVTQLETDSFFQINRGSGPVIFYVGDADPQTVAHKGTLRYGPSLSKSIRIDYSCFVKGTLITLADGNRKKVEDLTYDDELLVWNFDEGHMDSAKLLWITDSDLKADHYHKVTFSDGTILKLVGSNGNCHRLYNYTDRTFQYATQITPGKQVYTENGIVTLVSCERIDEEVEYYNLITKKHINCFAEGVLAASHFNNVYPIDEDMKFVKDGRKIRPWSEFRKEFKKAGIGKDWYEGVRLYEQPDSIDDVVNRLAKKEAIRQPRPEQPGFFARIWNWIKGLFS